MNGKIFAFYVSVVCVCVRLFGGCRSAPVGTGTNIAGISQELGKQSEAAAIIDRAIRESNSELQDCIDRSRAIKDLTERNEYLFNCYERAVERILSAYRSAGGADKGTEEVADDTHTVFSDTVRNSADDYIPRENKKD